jgi:probable rRNA maturation factor
MPVKFANYKEIQFKMNKPRITSTWIREVAKHHKKNIGDIQFVFCSDEELLQMNRQFLQHDFYTDIITFDYSIDKIISGDVYISIDRVSENAEKHTLDFKVELHRVLIHGILHLCGFKDKKRLDQKEMRKQEDKALKNRPLSLK